jgi:hypothetical protein
MEGDISRERLWKIELYAHAARSHGAFLSVITGCFCVWHVNHIQKRRVRNRLAVNRQNSKMHLMDVKGVQLVSPILDDPFLRCPGAHRDSRWPAHAVGLEHGARFALNDIKIDLVRQTRSRVLGHGNHALMPSRSRDQAAEKTASGLLGNLRDRGFCRCPRARDYREPTFREPIAGTTCVHGMRHKIGLHPRRRRREQHFEPARGWHKLRGQCCRQRERRSGVIRQGTAITRYHLEGKWLAFLIDERQVKECIGGSVQYAPELFSTGAYFKICQRRICGFAYGYGRPVSADRIDARVGTTEQFMNCIDGV